MRVAITLFFILISTCIGSAQISLPRINSLSKTYAVGYSLGVGQGGSFLYENLFEETPNGAVGFGIVVNLRQRDIIDGDESHFVILARINYHPYLFDNERIDIYGFGGLGLGVENLDNDTRYMGPREEIDREYTAWSIGAGMSYELYRSIGVFAEAGYGTGYLTAGLLLTRF